MLTIIDVRDLDDVDDLNRGDTVLVESTDSIGSVDDPHIFQFKINLRGRTIEVLKIVLGLNPVRRA